MKKTLYLVCKQYTNYDEDGNYTNFSIVDITPSKKQAWKIEKKLRRKLKENETCFTIKKEGKKPVYFIP